MKKTKDVSGTRPQNAKLSTLEILLASTDAIESGITPGKPVKPFQARSCSNHMRFRAVNQ